MIPQSQSCCESSQTVPQQAYRQPRRIPKWLLTGVIVMAAIAAILWAVQDYIKAAFFCDITIQDGQSISLDIGDSKKLSCNYDLWGLSQSEVTWESSDPSIAAVSKDGNITAIDEGAITVTVSIKGFEKDSCTVSALLEPVSIRNGEMVVSLRDTDYPEVTINAPKDANCFVYFENTKNDANDFAFYVKAGSSATVNAPVGTYNFFYATGDNWYGKDLKFGRGTDFFKSPDQITLTEDSTSYDVLELTLYAVPDGNMDTRPIDAGEFPI